MDLLRPIDSENIRPSLVEHNHDKFLYSRLLFGSRKTSALEILHSRYISDMRFFGPSGTMHAQHFRGLKIYACLASNILIAVHSAYIMSFAIGV